MELLGSKRIVFFDTLLEKLSHKEIEAVIAHELGHFHHNHVKKMMVMQIILFFVFAKNWMTENQIITLKL